MDETFQVFACLKDENQDEFLFFFFSFLKTKQGFTLTLYSDGRKEI